MKTFTYQDFLQYDNFRHKHFGYLLHNFTKQLIDSDSTKYIIQENTEYTYLNPKYNYIESTPAFNKIINTNISTNYSNKIFKNILSNKKLICSIINKVLKLKNKITYNDINEYNILYITPVFKSQLNIIYKLNNKQIFFLIEYLPKVDYIMPFRILDYEVNIISQNLEFKKIKRNSKLPMVIPIILYDGLDKFKIDKCEYQKKFKYLPIKFGEYNILNINC